MFGMLCFLFSMPFYRSDLPAERKKAAFLVIGFSGIAYGVIMEFVQKYWIPNRSFELWDIAADSTGCLLFWLWSLRKV